MESKHKNALIGALLAVVFVMAVGYAAFATTLTINGTASISSSWDVHFDNTKTTVTPTTGTGGTTAPSGTISYSSDNLTATLTANLIQPGDSLVYVLTPHNYGSIAAKTTGAVAYVSAGSSTSNAQASANAQSAGDQMTITSGSGSKQVGNIIYQVSFNPKASVAGTADDNDITVTVTFDSAATTTGTEYAAIHVTIPYVQA
ncbi:MAG: hypothetical protein IKG27_04125 [Bacilli bacterium]|nr:hypothetical protein [Bacilli bacterium]